jgi:hypothetical protein
MCDSPCNMSLDEGVGAWFGALGGAFGLMKPAGAVGLALGGPVGCAIGIAVAGAGGALAGSYAGMQNPARGVVNGIFNTARLFLP